VTDADEFTAILGAFPMTSEQVDALRRRADMLLGKAQNPRKHGGDADGTMSEREWYQLRKFVFALRDLADAARHIEDGTDPCDDDIPF
jgi:hypothetical protein